MLRNPKPTTTRILVKLRKNVKKPVSDKYKYNAQKNIFEELTDSGMILSIKSVSEIDDLKRREMVGTQEAYVIKLGSKAFYDKGGSEVKEGDLVLICRYCGDDQKDIEEGEIYRIIQDEDIQQIYEGENLYDNN